MRNRGWQARQQEGLAKPALADSTSAALLVGTVAYGVYLVAGPPVSTWNPPLGIVVLLVAGYATLTVFAWHLLLRKERIGHRVALLVGAVAGAVTLALFVMFNALVIVLSLVLQFTGL